MQTVLPFHHNPTYFAEDFLVSPANEEAYRWISGDNHLWHNGTLVLWGEAGCGKTHLTHIWSQQHQAKLLTTQHLERIAEHYTTNTPPMWIIDDVDEKLAKDLEESTLFHLLNIVTQEKGNLLLTAKTPPARWKTELKDLASRLHAISTVGLHLPDEALMKALLLKLFSDRQLLIQEDVADYIITRIERNFEALQHIVTTLDHASMRQKRNITTPLAREIINNLSSSHY